MEFVAQEYVPAFPLKRLKPDPENPWQGDDAAIGQLIDENGFYGAVLVQAGSDRIIAGHTRVRRARFDGVETIPALVLDVTDDEARRILVGDNRGNQRGKFEPEALQAVLQRVQGSGRGFAGTGFVAEDLAKVQARIAAGDGAMRATHSKRAVQFEAEERPLCPTCHQRIPRGTELPEGAE